MTGKRYRDQHILSLLLLVFITFFLAACDRVLEVSIERTVATGETVTPPAGRITAESAPPTPMIATLTAPGKNVEAPVAAMATMNAYLATQVAAQHTPVPASTPIPAPAETPTLPPPAGVSPEFWESVGVSPDTLAAILIQPGITSSRFGDIATMHVDGTHPVQITTYNYNADPVLSPDHRRIAYRSAPASITCTRCRR